MKPTTTLALIGLLAAASHAVKVKNEPADLRTSGKVMARTPRNIPGPNGISVAALKLTLVDDAGHTEEYILDARSKITCDGRPLRFSQSPVPGRCARVVNLSYNAQTKHASILELRTIITGEVAGTDVIRGKISVRESSGKTLNFSVRADNVVLFEAPDSPATAKSFESVKVGDRVEIFSKDGRYADEIHVRPAER